MYINLKHIRFIDSKGGSEIMAESRFSSVTGKDVEIVRENRTPLNTQKLTMWNNVCMLLCAIIYCVENT